MADVFISYAREDRPRAEQIARALSAMGLECFWDTEIPPGQTWADYIENKLSQCKAVIVLWSAHSTRSQWVREEARMGRDRGQLIPVMLDASAPPFGFGEVQAADLSGWQGEPHHPGWSALSRAAYTSVRGADAPPTPSPAASVAPAAPQFAYAAASPATAAEVLSPWGYVQKCLRMYFNGKGRARRSEFAWFGAFFAVVMTVASFGDVFRSGINPMTGMANSFLFTFTAWALLVCPFTSAAARRFHDIGQSGWIAALAPAPYVGALMGLILMFIPGQPGPNQFGASPKPA